MSWSITILCIVSYASADTSCNFDILKHHFHFWLWISSVSVGKTYGSLRYRDSLDHPLQQQQNRREGRDLRFFGEDQIREKYIKNPSCKTELIDQSSSHFKIFIHKKLHTSKFKIWKVPQNTWRGGKSTHLLLYHHSLPTLIICSFTVPSERSSITSWLPGVKIITH